MTCAPVRAAVQAISEGIGQLPVHVYERVGEAKERAPDHHAHKLLHDEANPWTPAALFREQITRDAALYPHGGFARIVRVDGKPAELHRIDQEQREVTVEANDYGEPYYTVTTGKGDPETVAFIDMLHIPSPSLNGRGLVHDAREAIGLALVMERHAARLFGNGARPSGILSLKNATTPDALLKARTAWQAAHGAIDPGAVEKHIRALIDTFDVREVNFDIAYAQAVISPLVADYGHMIATLRQGWITQSPALNTLEAAIVNGKFQHGGHPVLRWNFANVAIHTDSAGNRTMHKGKSTERIDGAVATWMAVSRAAAGGSHRSLFDDPSLTAEDFVC